MFNEKKVVCQKINLNKIESDTLNADEFDMNIYEYDDNNKNNTEEQTIDINDDNSNSCSNSCGNSCSNNNEIDKSDENSDDELLADLEESSLVQEDVATIQISSDKLKNIPNRYDVYITYDQYYRTPRIWFVGTSVDGHQLSQKETYEDFMPEYLNISLTMELNPILNIHCTSVHPCKHAYAMKRMFAFDMESKDESEICIENYLVYFLKFVSSVIPQLEFDRTSLPL